ASRCGAIESRNMRIGIARLAIGITAAAAMSLHAPSGRPPGARYQGNAYDFRKSADGVWFAVGTGVVSAESNNVVIETATDVIVVDGTTSPPRRWARLQEISRVTRKPVRYL